MQLAFWFCLDISMQTFLAMDLYNPYLDVMQMAVCCFSAFSIVRLKAFM